MRRLLRAELRKVTATPVTWWLLLATIAIGILGVAIRRHHPPTGSRHRGDARVTVLVEPALFAAAPHVFRWLPGLAALSLRRQPSDDLPPWRPAAAVLTGVIAVAMTLGVRMVERHDVAR